jgi:hypothetical protein
MTLSEAADTLYRKSYGAISIRKKAAIAKKHRPALTKFFRKQRDLVLDKLADQKYLFSESYRALAEGPVDFTLQNWDRIWDTVDEATRQELQDLIIKIEAEGLPSGADTIRKVINPAGQFWDLGNPRAVSWMMQHGGSIKYIKDIQDTTANSLKNVMGTALDEGWSYQTTAREIQKLYDGPISRERAQVIAVHESAQAYEAGNRTFVDGLADEGIEMEKLYQTSEDDKVSDLCRQNQANDESGVGSKWIPLDQPHFSGVQSPPGHIRCRCYEVYRAVSVGRKS